MTRVDRGTNLLAHLLSDSRLSTGSIAFVAHSFGGLVVEQLIRSASERSNSEPEVKRLLGQIERITFLGTPHRGADLATWGGRFGLIFRPSAAAEGLTRNDPDLRDLNYFYRRYSQEAGIDTQSLTETKPLRWLGMIVKPDSSDIGLPSPPISIDDDHFGIASPASKQSEVYKLVLNHLRKRSRTRTLIADPAVLEELSTSAAQTSDAVARIEATLSTQAIFALVPSEIVDSEIKRRILRLRQMRFFLDSTHLEEASQLANELRTGQFRSASIATKADALAWCTRLLLARPDRQEARDTLQEALKLRRTEAVSIAEAFVDSHDGDYTSALRKLSVLDSQEARAASFIVVANSKGAIDPLVWIEKTGFSASDMVADGKFFLLQKTLEAKKWQAALAQAKELTESDFREAPVLAYLCAGTHLVVTIPVELRHNILQQPAFETATLPLADDAQSILERKRAAELYTLASDLANELGCLRVANDASDRALWLRLRDTSERDSARIELEKSMRDPKQSLRRLPLAVQFGLRLDLLAAERQVDRSEALVDGNSLEVALARFSLALTKSSPREGAEYIAQHRQKLAQHLNAAYVAAVEIQMLADSGQADAAEQRLDDIPADQRSTAEFERLKRLVAEAKGADPVASREEAFKKTDSLADLANLVQRLEELSSWPRLVTYGREYFSRTKGLSALRSYAAALYELKAFGELVAVLTSNADLVGQSPFLESILGWAHYKQGDIKSSKNVLQRLRASRDDGNDRTLLVHLALTSGDWSSLGAFVEQEWERRADRSAEELLRAGQLAQQLGSARAKELIIAASVRAPDSPAILLGCYGAAVSGGWEAEQSLGWLQRAAELSGDDGPVQKVAFKEIFEGHSSWQERETRTWEQLTSGNLPAFAAGQLLNRSLLELFLVPAIANADTVDPRKRATIFAYSGARLFFAGQARTAAFDPTALVTLALLRLLEPTLDSFDRVVVPHSTLTWLFEERQRLMFHQPSRVEEAREIRALLAANKLQRFERTAPVDPDLVSEVGVDLAGMLAEAALPSDHAQQLVVRSSPVHRVGSLMEEHADLSRFGDQLCGCNDVVTALVRAGQLTQAEEQKARSYLKLNELPWPSPPSIKSGARLYLDGLSVTYLRHLGLLRKLGAAGFVPIVAPSDISQSDWLVRYEALSQEALAAIDHLRDSLAKGIERGKVQLAPTFILDDEQSEARLANHPSFEIMSAARLADVLVIDDRHFNQHGALSGDFGSRPVWSTYDIISFQSAGLAELIERVTSLRRAGYCYIPLRLEELTALVKSAHVADGGIVETAELKAIRENLLQTRLSDSLQWPKEQVWLDNLTFAFTEAIKAQWDSAVDPSEAAAKSDWLLTQFDVRHWSSRYSPDGSVEAMENRYKGFVLLLATLNTGVPLQVKQQYWDWYNRSILTPVRDDYRAIYDAVIQQVRAVVEGAVDLWADEAGDGKV